MSDENNLFFVNLVKQLQDEDTHIAMDGKSSGEYKDFIDSGSYALNALLSGSIYTGIPDNKRVMYAGESSVGKTFFAISTINEMLAADPKAGVIYYDSESALTKQMLVDRGVDASRVIIVDIDTVQKLRTHILRVVKAYTSQPEKLRHPVIMVVDSLGNLSTSKEQGDIEEGKDTRDMTRAQLLRGLGRSVTVPLAKAKIPLLITNHTYTTMSLFPTQELSGGGGVRYISDIIVFLTKAQDKVQATGVHKGIFITARIFKSRLTREKSVVKLKLSFTTGLDRYFGLLDIAERTGIVTKVSTKYKLPGGIEAKESAIYSNPEKFFTPELLELIDKGAGELFKYGGKISDDVAETATDDTVDE